jgi:hypothetical protein
MVRLESLGVDIFVLTFFLCCKIFVVILGAFNSIVDAYPTLCVKVLVGSFKAIT